MLLRRALALFTVFGPPSVAAMSSSTANTKKGALVFLHGLGDTPAGWAMLQNTLPTIKPRLKDIHYIFPHAPIISISINGGARMPGWFDLYDWPIGVGAQDDRKGKLEGVEILEEYVEKLKTEHGIERDRIVVGGFSQGGAIALLAAYHQIGNKQPYAGCAALSGWLTLTSDLSVPETVAQKTPLLWAHGTYDDKVLFEHQAFGVKKLEEQGVQVEALKYPMGHQSSDDEIVAFATFLDRTLFGSNDEL